MNEILFKAISEIIIYTVNSSRKKNKSQVKNRLHKNLYSLLSITNQNPNLTIRNKPETHSIITIISEIPSKLSRYP